jgi:hypothetical protein
MVDPEMAHGRDNGRQASESLHFRTSNQQSRHSIGLPLSCKQAQNGGHKPRPY